MTNEAADRPFYNDLQVRLLQASMALSKLVDEPIVRSGVSDDEIPCELDDLAELSNAVAQVVDPIFRDIARMGNLKSKYTLFDDLCSSHINDYISSELRSKAQDIREEEPALDPSRRGDDMWKMRREPA